MSMMLSRPESSELLLSLSAALNEFVNGFDLTPERNIVVHCFDSTVDDWATLPAAWHRPLDGDIVLNMGTVFKSLLERESHFSTTLFQTRDGRYEADEDLIARTARSIRAISASADRAGTRYQTFLDAEGVRYNPRPVANTHRALRENLRTPSGRLPAEYLQATLFAILLHETGHATFSQYITEDWFTELTPYERKIMTVFEELRCERQQLGRVGLGGALIRRAADVVVDPTRVAADIAASRDEGGKVHIPNLALNSTLCLGRISYDVFLEREVATLARLVETTVGDDRYEQMRLLWDEFSGIRELDPAAMTSVVRRWAELFPSARDGSRVHSSVGDLVEPPESPGDDSAGGGAGEDDGGFEEEETLALPGLADELAEEVRRSGASAEEFPDDDNHTYGPADRKPSATSHAEAERASKFRSEGVTFHTPHTEDLLASKKLAQELRQLNVSVRGRVLATSKTPPGRLRGRAMVQRAADRSQGRTSEAEPWRRVRRTVDVNPPLTVGIMTDTSGSQEWATEFSSRLAWILARAVSEINGRVAAVTFGSEVRIVQRPGEHQKRRMQVEANADTELFDTAMGSLDTMLRLVGGAGTRIVFVVTDGVLVQDDGLEMAKAADWVTDLTRSGCLVVWVTRHHGYRAFGRPTTPEGATPLRVNHKQVAEDPRPAIDQVVHTIKQAMARQRTR